MYILKKLKPIFCCIIIFDFQIIKLSVYLLRVDSWFISTHQLYWYENQDLYRDTKSILWWVINFYVYLVLIYEVVMSEKMKRHSLWSVALSPSLAVLLRSAPYCTKCKYVAWWMSSFCSKGGNFALLFGFQRKKLSHHMLDILKIISLKKIMAQMFFF